jgi:hypothetical protein
VTPEFLYDLLHQKPFVPLRVHLKDGRVFEIRYPHNNVVGVDYFAISIPEPGTDGWVAAQVFHVPLSLIQQVEAIRETVTVLNP